MRFDLRLPNINAPTEREQLAQIKSYLYQFAEQLRWAFDNIDVASTPNQVLGKAQGKDTSKEEDGSAQVTFNSLKPLIIKSADIVQAYYDEISTRLEGLYVAESDFGTFIEKTEQETNQSATDIEQLFSNFQQILTDIENLNFTLAEVNAHIRSGLLYYDENSIPVYGLEVGQRTTVDGEEVFNKYARFTSDRLSFYDQNDTEVAYISDYKLYIRNVEITSIYKIGGLRDTVMANGDVVTKWVGGDG